MDTIRDDCADGLSAVLDVISCLSYAAVTKVDALMVCETMAVLDYSVGEGMISWEKNGLLPAEWYIRVLQSPANTYDAIMVEKRRQF